MDLETRLLAAVKALFAGESSGHDAAHSIRVYRTAMRIAAQKPCDREIVTLASLLHDADDVKLFRTENFANARRIMAECGVENARAERAIEAIRTVSFKGTDSVVPETIEGKIVQDADRLDAIGAIGVARAFAYGGAKGRAMYDPAVPPEMDMDEARYRSHEGTTVNHFYEKLFLLRERMNTAAAREIAARREAFMRAFLEEFYAEWEGER